MGDNAAEYGQKLKQFYNDRISDLESAQGLVGSFDEGAQTGAALMRFIINQYRARHPHANIGALRMLDVGCGVGRYMRAAKSLGAAVDGCDVSDKMIELARADDALADCDLWVTQGYDCGDAPKAAYDVIFSVFCMQHLSHRGLRMKLWSAMNEHLKSDGMVIIEFQNYPDISAADIPPAHANWMESRVSDVSNSEADVWITPDMISYAWADWRANYSDPAMQAVEIWPDAASYARQRDNHEATLPYEHRFEHIYFTGWRQAGLVRTVYEAGLTLPRRGLVESSIGRLRDRGLKYLFTGLRHAPN